MRMWKNNFIHTELKSSVLIYVQYILEYCFFESSSARNKLPLAGSGELLIQSCKYKNNCKRQSRKSTIWLTSNPFKYPEIPNRGIKKNTPMIRIHRLVKFAIKEKKVLPSPLMILRSTVFVYRNGQIQASERMKSAARLL